MHLLGENSLYPCFKSTLGFFVSYAADKVPLPKLLSERLVYLWRIRAKFNRKSFPFVSGCLQICKICWIILYIFLYTCLCHVHWVHVLVKCTAGHMVLQERIQNDRFGPNPFQKLWTPSWLQELEQHAEHHWRVESPPSPIPTPSLRALSDSGCVEGRVRAPWQWPHSGPWNLWIRHQGMWAASRCWQRQGNRFFPRASRRNAVLIPWLQPSETFSISHLQNC